MPNSYVEYTTTGSGTNGLGQTTFTAPAKFLNINDIRIKGLNGSTWTELTISSRGTTTVTLSAAPTSGSYSKIRAFRSSTTEPLIDFQNGSRLSESDLDTAYQQGLFVAQEVAEDADPEGGSGIGNIVSSQLAGISITNDKLAGGITQDKLAGSIADSKLASGVGTSANNLVKLDGTAKLPAVDGSQLTNVSAGKVLQVVNTTVSTSTTSTTAIPADDSIPQITEGKEVMTLAITPSSASNKLLIQVVAYGASSPDAVMTSALFQDSTANAIGAVTAFQSTATGTHALQFNHYMLAGTTNATTFKVRLGVNTGTLTFNGHSGVRMLGGVASSSITITEIAP
jgi:hypothetical protein